MIIAHGARTPVGLQAVTSAAAVRAGIVGFREHPFLVDSANAPVVCAFDRLLDPRLMGARRLIALAEPALREALRPLARAPGAAPKVPLLLALPELRPGFSAADGELVRSGIVRLAELPVPLSEVEAIPAGHAAGLSGFERALDQLAGRTCDICLVGGVDSYLRPATIEWLDAHRQLASKATRSGFVPGEAAGFCLLANEHGGRQLGVRALARVRSVGVARETKLIKTSTVCVGEGLTAAVRAAGADLSLEERLDDIICDINGERYRSEEWGFVCLKGHPSLTNPSGYNCPAESWGDVGAASGPLFAVLACQAAARGYARGPRTLLWASSERGLRAAAVLDTRAEAGRSDRA